MRIINLLGLVGNGEEWQKARSLVQQDMMRPKSAMFYINDLSHVVDEMIDKIESIVDENRKVDITHTLCEFALDAVGVMFIGSKLGVLQGSQYGKDMIRKVNRIMELGLTCVFIPPNIAKYFPVFKEYVQHTKDVFLLSNEKINEAMKKHEVDGSLKGTILLKLIERCGAESDIPTITANDALLAGKHLLMIILMIKNIKIFDIF